MDSDAKDSNTTGHESVQQQQQQQSTTPKADAPSAKPLFLPPATASSSSPSSSPPSSRSKDNKDRPYVKPDDTYPHHALFVVHGMGRQLEEFGNYERNVSYLVENTKAVLQTQFHNLKTNVHIIPIEWHAKLHSMVDERMALASLRTVPKVRMVMNDYFADILYYFNNHYGAEIVRMIVDELNEAYETFLAKHPDFNGKISVYALSLGGVAMFDILTCMDDDEPEDKHREGDQKTPEQKASSNTSDPGSSTSAPSIVTASQERPRIRKQDQPKFNSIIPKLKFRPDYLFTVGSPVGAVMVMRNLDWETFHPPDDIIHHNLFHPFDPLAYRIEPLIDSTFAAIPAVTLSSYSNSQRFPLSLPSLSSIPLIPESLSAFWETKVPALPRPSIPTLSTLSQMTQSLKAGKWLSGTGNGNQTSDDSTPTDARDDNNQGSAGQDNNTKDRDRSSESESESHHQGDHPVHTKSRFSRRMDADVSAQEAIAAVTAATYLDHRESVTRPVDSPMLGANATTTIGSDQFRPSPSRRPNLGPRRISSRVEDDIENGKQEASEMSKKMPGLLEEHDREQPLDVDTPSSLTQASADPSEEVPPPLQMEYYFGMELGPTAQEIAYSKGAKSNAVQEDMVRSMPNSPVREFIEANGEEATTKTDKQVTFETVEEDQDEDGAGKPKARSNGGKKQKLRVGGRPTKVPYRIDHVLQESTVDQYTNEYLLGMRSHFRYWGNRDIAYHILKCMLNPEGAVVEGEVLELTPEMPAPITAPKGVKEAAEAKAKAAAAAYHSSKKGDAKQQHRKSFSFSFFGNERSSEDHDAKIHSRPSTDSYDEYGLDMEGELYGYRYSDLDMGSAANVGFPSNTLYQNSPFATTTGSSSSYSMAHEYHHQKSKRRSSSSASIQCAVTASSTTQTTISTGAPVGSESPTQTGAFDEGVIVVPDLAKPAKLHHRSSRVEEKR
ncbi:hypothetical protein BG006_004899 [Podila minutissima]|uniref:DDHD domain-containing protein n=1 Tax=Podila minutissima TaxID=64525 RepID=A0A9P5SKI3_9FUNG|nr:hypothetical protein BG006_004899 [Podila minutissima]